MTDGGLATGKSSPSKIKAESADSHSSPQIGQRSQPPQPLALLTSPSYMPKRLELKETKAEKEEKEYKRMRKEARKAARYHVDEQSSSTSHSATFGESSGSSRNFGRGSRKQYDLVFDDLDEGTWTPSSTSIKADKEAIRTQMEEDEEQAFRAKLFDAMEMDLGQDSAYSHFNSYAHIPARWKERSPTSRDLDDAGPPDPNYMNDEQYVEYVRQGMWERTHKAEAEERQRRKERAQERKEKEKRLKEESKRLEAEAIEERRRRREEKDKRKLRDSWMAYESRWSTLQKAAAASTILPDSLDFAFLPWPVHPPPKSIDALTKESISAFVLSDLHSGEKSQKQRLRDALLLYHPDRFESKFMAFVRDQDRTLVTEGVGRVVRALNALTEEGR